MEGLEPEAAAGLVEHYPPSLPYPMDKQPSFSDRITSMQRIANNLVATAKLLTTFAEEIDAEAERMAAAQKRFAERRSFKRKASH